MTAERYTAVFTGLLSLKKPGEYPYLSMSGDPLAFGGGSPHRGRPHYERMGYEISFEDLPKEPIAVLGERMSLRINTLVRDMIFTSKERGEISLSEKVHEALMKLRAWLFKNVYLSPLSRESRKVEDVVAALFKHYLERPEERPKTDSDPITETIDFVAGMTDRYALAAYKRLFLPRSDTIFK